MNSQHALSELSNGSGMHAMDPFNLSLEEMLDVDGGCPPARANKRARIEPTPQPLGWDKFAPRTASAAPAPQLESPPPNMWRRPSLSSPATCTVVRNFINNEMSISNSTIWIKVMDPATQKLLARAPESTLAEVQQAVASAEMAQRAWKLKSISQRRSMLLSLKDALQKSAAAFQQALQVEVGKSQQDAASEIERALEAVETACSAAVQISGSHWTTDKSDTYTVHQALGVCLSITPFNFPLLIPLWSIPIALMCGNTTILKPSEKAPTVAALLAQCFSLAQFPAGVFSTINGSSKAVGKLLAQPSISAISFVGSEIAGEGVYEHARATRKRIQVESSGKNHGVLLNDADRSSSLYAIAGSAFGSAGQRCMALSVVICVGDTIEWIDELVTLARTLKVGSGNEADTNIGPLITAAAKQRVEALIDSAVDEGARVVLDGRKVSVPGYPHGNFVGPTIIIDVKTYMQCYQEEIFGPVLVCVRVDTLDEAIEVVNENRYGNGCTLFTTNPTHAKHFQEHVNVGQIGINVPILAPSGPVPRTSNKDSYLGEGSDHSQWRFFTATKTVTTLW